MRISIDGTDEFGVTRARLIGDDNDLIASFNMNTVAAGHIVLRTYTNRPTNDSEPDYLLLDNTPIVVGARIDIATGTVVHATYRYKYGPVNDVTHEQEQRIDALLTEFWTLLCDKYPEYRNDTNGQRWRLQREREDVSTAYVNTMQRVSHLADQLEQHASELTKLNVRRDALDVSIRQLDEQDPAINTERRVHCPTGCCGGSFST